MITETSQECIGSSKRKNYNRLSVILRNTLSLCVFVLVSLHCDWLQFTSLATSTGNQSQGKETKAKTQRDRVFRRIIDNLL